MTCIVLSVKVEEETLRNYKSLAELKGCTLSKLLGAVLDEYVELGLADAETESEVEVQTGVLIPTDGATPGTHLMN